MTEQSKKAPGNGAGSEEKSTQKKHAKRSFPRRLWTWTWKTLLGLVLFVLSLPFLLLLAWQVEPVRDGVKKIAVSVSGSFLEGKLEIGSLGGNLWSSLSINNVRWYDKQGDLMVAWNQLRVEYDLLHLIKTGEILVNEVRLNKPQGHVTTDKQGRINVLQHIKPLQEPSPPSPKPEKPSKSTLQVKVQDIIVNDLDATYKSAPKAKPIRVKDLDLRADYTLDLGQNTMTSKLRHFSMQTKNPDVNLKKLNLVFWKAGEKLGVKGFHLRAGKATEVKLFAQVGLDKPLSFRVRLERLFVHPDDLHNAFPSIPLQQPVSARMRADGTLKSFTAWLRANAGKASIKLDAQSGQRGLETYSGTLAVSDVNLQSLLGKKSLQSDISLRLHVQGQGFSTNTDATARLTILPGYFQSKKYRWDRLHVLAKADDGVVKVKKFNLRTPFGRLTGHATADINKKTYKGYLFGKLPRLRRIGQVLQQTMRGALQFKAEGEGTFSKPRGRVRVWLSRAMYRTGKTKAYVRHVFLQARLLELQPLTLTTVLWVRRALAANRRLRTLRINAWARVNLKTNTQTVRLSRFSFDIGTGLFQLERRASLTVAQAAQVQIRRLYWKNRKERIRIHGRFNWKRWTQDLTVAVENLRLGPLRQALEILPKDRIAGRVSLRVGARGSFVHPRLQLGLKLDDVRYNKLQELNGEVKLSYPWKRHHRLHMLVNVQRKRNRVLHVETRIPMRLNLERVALRGKMNGLLLLDRPFLLHVSVPRLSLAWLGKAFKQPELRGVFRSSITLTQTLENPKVAIEAYLQQARWKDVRGVSADIYMRYKRGALTFSRPKEDSAPEPTAITIKGQKVITLAGSLPLVLGVRERRGQIQPIYRLLNRAMSFNATFVRQKLGEVIRQIVPSLHKKIASIEGFFSGHVRLRGKPTHPLVDAQLKLEEGSFCPMTEEGFTCKLVVSTDKTGAYRFQKAGNITKTLTRVASLRVKKVLFLFDMSYRPPRTQREKGKLTLSSKLDIGDKRVFALGRYASNRRVCSQESKKKGSKKKDSGKKKGTSRVLLSTKKKPPAPNKKNGASGQAADTKQGSGTSPSSNQFDSQFAVTFSMNPRTMKPSFELYDDLQLFLEIPAIRFQRIAQWVRYATMQKLEGVVQLKTSVCGYLTNPDVDLQVGLHKLKYELGVDSTGRKLSIDRARVDLNVSIHKRDLEWKLKTKLLGQKFLHSEAKIKGIGFGLDPKTFKILRRKTGIRVDALASIPGFPLHQLANRLEYRDIVYGTLKTKIHLKGDPACLTLSTTEHTDLHHTNGKDRARTGSDKDKSGNSQKAPEKFVNHLTIDNFYLGMSRERYDRLRKQGIPSTELSALHLRRFRLAMKSLEKGRIHLHLGMWHANNPDTQSPDMLVGEVRWPVPLALLPASASLLQRQNRCPHWPGGRPSQQIKVLLSHNAHPLPLRFLESFVPGLEMDVDLAPSVLITGTTKEIEKSKGSIQLRIHSIAMKQYGLAILSNIEKLRKKNSESYRRCRMIRHSRNQNKETEVYDHYIRGCIYSYLRVDLKPKSYRVTGRLQGKEGKPLLLYGGIPRESLTVAVDANNPIKLFVRSTDFQPMATSGNKLTLQTKINVVKRAKQALKVSGSVQVPNMLFTLPDTSGSGKSYQDHKDLVVLGEPSEKRLYPGHQRKEAAKPKKDEREQKKQLQKNLQTGKASGQSGNLLKGKSTTGKQNNQKRKQNKQKKNGQQNKQKKPTQGLPEASNLLVDLKVIIRRGARVRNGEFDITFRTSDNNLQVRLSDSLLALTGGVQVVRGDLMLYSKKFSIKPDSSVQFSGQSVALSNIANINARLDVTATHLVRLSGEERLGGGSGRIKILLAVDGTLQNPQIKLSAQDAGTEKKINMSNADILSLLLTGSTTGNLGRGDLSGQAVGALSRVVSSQVQTAVSRVVPIDVLKIDTGARVQDISITIGKNFTNWLYTQIEYQPTPLDNEDLWELMFQAQLSRGWSFELRFGERRRDTALLFRGSTYFFYKTKR